MPLKLNISNKGKAWKLEVDTEVLAGKSIGDSIPGKELKPELEGYELEITGGSDKAGFPLNKNVEGIALKGVLSTKGFGMKDPRKGIRLRKTQRGKTISETTVQVNLNITKEGSKKLEEVFPEQVPAPEAPTEEAKPEEATPTENAEAPKEEVKEESKPEEKPAEEAPKEEVKE